MTTSRRCYLPGNPCRPILFMLLLSLTACKKDSVKDDGFPVLGTCKPVSATNGLTYESAAGTLTYKTRGGGIIQINESMTINIRHEEYEGFTIQLWGDKVVDGKDVYPADHENLNGKHIKDRVGPRRTVIFPDGAKFTLVADGERGNVVEISIYDGDVVHHINTTCNTLELSSSTPGYAEHFDKLQADGEASTIEFTETGLFWVNIYTENTVGDKVEKRQLLGELARDDPNMVNDYFDDPRIDHT